MWPDCGFFDRSNMAVRRRANSPANAHNSGAKENKVANSRLANQPSESLDLSSLNNAFGILGAVAAIDQVHGIRKYDPTIGVLYDPLLASSGSKGMFRGRASDGYPEIGIQPGMPPAIEAATFTHEFGHLLDYTLKSGPGYASESNDDLMKEWDVAVKASSSYKRLSALTSADGTVDRERALTIYLMKGRELFARSYAQFIAARCHDQNLLNWLEVMTDEAADDRMPSQWTEEDFAPIAVAIENTLRKIKYMK